jgi:hypothetical protein
MTPDRFNSDMIVFVSDMGCHHGTASLERKTIRALQTNSPG